MKSNRSSSAWPIFGALLAILIVAFVFAVSTQPVTAQVLPADPLIAQLIDITPVTVPPAAVTPTPAPSGAVVVAATPWYADGTVIGGIIAAVTSLLAIWSHKEKTKAQKISESLIVGIETATKIPAVAEKEKLIKASIQNTAQRYGVQPILDRLVQNLT